MPLFTGFPQTNLRFRAQQKTIGRRKRLFTPRRTQAVTKQNSRKGIQILLYYECANSELFHYLCNQLKETARQ